MTKTTPNHGTGFCRTGLRSMLRTVLAGGVFASGLAFATPALADFRVCNSTQEQVGVAIGYRARAGWVTEGWWLVDPASCTTLIQGPLGSRYYYLYAEDNSRGGRWEGDVQMCVANREFKITGVNDCFARGFQRAGFREYDTGNQQSWMVQLIDDQAEEEPTTPPTDTPIISGEPIQ